MQTISPPLITQVSVNALTDVVGGTMDVSNTYNGNVCFSFSLIAGLSVSVQLDSSNDGSSWETGVLTGVIAAVGNIVKLQLGPQAGKSARFFRARMQSTVAGMPGTATIAIYGQ